MINKLQKHFVLILIIGGLIGAWCASGTIAYITALGLKMINPQYFLATAFAITFICACFTGTSFGTCGTIGVALMGVAAGMGIDTYWAASAILCAAVIGDGLSPLSDTPNVIAGATNVDVFKSVTSLQENRCRILVAKLRFRVKAERKGVDKFQTVDNYEFFKITYKRNRQR